MRRVGRVVGTAQGSVIVRSPDETVPSVGETVVDETLEPVGRVVDIIGPVERPYVVVRPGRGVSPAALVNEPVYVR